MLVHVHLVVFIKAKGLMKMHHKFYLKNDYEFSSHTGETKM